MSDRCWLQITVAPHSMDRQGVRELLEVEMPDEQSQSDGGWYEFEFESINWGGADLLEQLSKWNAKFIGHSSAGGDYGAAVFHSPGDGLLFERETGHRGGYVLMQLRVQEFNDLRKFDSEHEEILKEANTRIEPLVELAKIADEEENSDAR